jgi:outer membrane protein assembly factor BamB|tara:strand:+ start:186 stop:1559 length:1374 start_codon:yes stop_codon:yes gene_type:complete
MKRLLLFFISLTLSSCSLDNKTGIWKDISNTPVVNQSTKSIPSNKLEVRYENSIKKNKIFNEEKEPTNFSSIEIRPPIKITRWSEQYTVPSNNISNFSYRDNKILLSKSSKLRKTTSSGNYSNKKIIFYKNNLISYDHNGTIFIYSLSSNKKIFEYNFYKKKFKNFNKKISLIVNENFLYVADNLGYLYALNLDDKSIIWAKNYGIPFRSNIKIDNNQLFLANQDNVIYSINSNTGDLNWQFATTLTVLKSDFENNFALDLVSNNLFFLNTSGELYSINYLTQKINWVLNFKKTTLAGDTALFFSQPLVIKNKNLLVVTEKAVISYDTLTSARNWIFSAEPASKPIITSDNTYIILKNNLLICLDNISGNVVWSKNIFKNTKDKKIIKKFNSVIDFKIVNSKINIYSSKGYLLSFNSSNGNLSQQSNISKNGISSKIVFLDNNMLFIDNSNKLLKFN